MTPVSSQKLSVETESGLLSCFRKDGLAPKPKRSTKPEPTGSTRLQLIPSKNG